MLYNNNTEPLLETMPDPVRLALGDMGPWQLKSVLLVSLVKVPSAWHMASILFTAPAPRDFWCARPQHLRHWDPDVWKELIHPVINDSDGRDPCNIYDVGYTMLLESTQTLTHNTSVRPCEHFEYSDAQDGISTVVTKWNLVCERKVLVSVSQLFYLLGILIGSILCMKLLLRYSPKHLLLAGAALQVGAGVGVALVQHFEFQVCLRFITAIACAHMFISGYSICTDITGGKWRVITGACYEHMWSVGVVTLAGLGYLLRDWYTLQLTISLPTLLLLLSYRWIPNSPTWLLNHERGEQAKEILQNAANCNGRDIPPFDIHPPAQNRMKRDEPWVKLFSRSKERRRIIPLHIAWAATVVTYYGALLNVKNIGEQVYVNTAIAGVAEVVGVLVGLALLLNSKGKWTSLGTFLVIGGSACMASSVLPSEDGWGRHWIMLALAMVGRVAIAASLTVLQLATNDVLPNPLRNIGFFSSVTFARVILLLAPFIGSLAMYGDYVSLSTFGAITVIGGLATLCLAQPRAPELPVIEPNVWVIQKPSDDIPAKLTIQVSSSISRFSKMGDEKDIIMLQPETIEEVAEDEAEEEQQLEVSPRPDTSDIETVTTEDGISPRADVLTDAAVLAELKLADKQARRTAHFIQTMRRSISHYTQKEDMTEEELEALENEQNELMKKLQEFEEITKRVQKLVGLSDTSTHNELWETFLDGERKALEAMGKGDDAEQADKANIPKLFLCGLQDDMSRLVMCESLKNEKTSPKKSEKSYLPQKQSCPDLMVTLTGRLNESYSMQEKLATENANLEGLRYSLQEELLHKDNALDFLQRQVGSLQAEMKIIVKENVLLNEKLVKLQEKHGQSEDTLDEAARTKQLESQLSQLETEMDALRNELNEVQNDRDEVKQQILLLQELEHVCSTQCAQGEGGLRLSELQQQYNKLKEDFQQRETKISTLHGELEKHKQLTETATEKQEKTEQRLYELEEKTKLQEMEIEKLLELKEQLIEQETQLNISKQRLRETQDELEEMRITSQEQLYQLDDYRNKYLQAQQHVEEQRRQIEVMEMDNTRVGEQINTEIQRIKNQFQEKLQELAPLPEILKATQMKLQESQQGRILAEHNLEETARELEDAKDQIASLQKQMEEERNSLLTSNEELQTRITAFENKCSELKEENTRLKATVALSEENAALSEKRLEEKAHEVAQLIAQLETLKQDTTRQAARSKERIDSMRRSLQSHISELERQLAQSRALTSAAQKERDEVRQRMQSQINTLSENFHEAQMRILSLQSHVNFLKTTYNNMFSGDQLSLGDVDLETCEYQL